MLFMCFYSFDWWERTHLSLQKTVGPSLDNLVQPLRFFCVSPLFVQNAHGIDRFGKQLQRFSLFFRSTYTRHPLHIDAARSIAKYRGIVINCKYGNEIYSTFWAKGSLANTLTRPRGNDLDPLWEGWEGEIWYNTTRRRGWANLNQPQPRNSKETQKKFKEQVVQFFESSGKNRTWIARDLLGSLSLREKGVGAAPLSRTLAQSAEVLVFNISSCVQTNLYSPEPISKIAHPFSSRTYETPSASSTGLPLSCI
jgi:hypothetical protein